MKKNPKLEKKELDKKYEEEAKKEVWDIFKKILYNSIGIF